MQGPELPLLPSYFCKGMSSGIAESHSRHSLLRKLIFISRPQAERLADVKSPHLQSAVTQQTVSSLFKNPVSFLIWTYCRKQTAGKGLTQKTSYWR